MKPLVLERLLLLASLSLLTSFVSGCVSHKNPSVQRSEMLSEAQTALHDLYRDIPGAQALGSKARGVLVFPKIVKGGFVAGGQYGEGTLFTDGIAQGYYRSVAASWGLQAGVQRFGYALFFMTDEDLKYIKSSEGWEVGVGPSITILDKGMAGAITTTTARKGVYAFFFDQRGLMAGLGIQGTKITKLDL